MANRKRTQILLKTEEREHLEALVRKGVCSAYEQRQARILLKRDEGKTDKQLVEMLDVSVPTIWRTEKRYRQGGMKAALSVKKRDRVYEKKVSGRTEAHLIQLACSKPPEGRAKWSVRLLAGKMVELGYIDSIGRECVRKALKKMNCPRT